MKHLVLAAAVAVASALALAPSVSDAKRFGGGSSSGMQRSMPNSAPAKPAAAAISLACIERNPLYSFPWCQSPLRHACKQ